MAEDLSRSRDFSQRDLHLSSSLTSSPLPHFPLSLILFWGRVLLCSPGQSWIHNPPASASGVAEITGAPPHLLKDWKYMYCKELQHSTDYFTEPVSSHKSTEKPEFIVHTDHLTGSSRGNLRRENFIRSVTIQTAKAKERMPHSSFL